MDDALHEAAVAALRAAFREEQLVLYLGAGVSAGSDLPDWDRLVTAMYFAALTPDRSSYGEIRHAYRNYLLAIADWYLGHERGAIDVVARKIRAHFGDRRAEFLEALRSTLYTPMIMPLGDFEPQDVEEKLEGNATLQQVARLCGVDANGHRGVRAVITYNYDDLLESVLDREGIDHVPIWETGADVDPAALPIYHVHGFVPFARERGGSSEEELIFSEAQFNAAANNPYHWANIVQLHHLTGSTGLAVGLSLRDRNLRRLLDAAARTPIKPRIYSVWCEEGRPAFGEADRAKIREDADEYRTRFATGAGMKTPDDEFQQIEQILDAVHLSDLAIQEQVLAALGVVRLDVGAYDRIEDLVSAIVE